MGWRHSIRSALSFDQAIEELRLRIDAEKARVRLRELQIAHLVEQLEGLEHDREFRKEMARKDHLKSASGEPPSVG